MERVAVTSSSIRSVGYDVESSVLEIEFNTGAIYQYSGVPQNEHDCLMAAPSQGIYFNANIKNRYPPTKL